jgi:hypothetical protein
MFRDMRYAAKQPLIAIKCTHHFCDKNTTLFFKVFINCANFIIKITILFNYIIAKKLDFPQLYLHLIS